MSYKNELNEAINIAKEVGKFQLEGQNNIKSIDIKKDKSPVTEIDQKSEQMIKDHLLGSFKDDGFLGEESGETKGKNNRQWIVDPLDGTRPFIHGIPTYSIMIALEENGEPVVGVIHFPALNETYYASKNSGAFLDEVGISVSNCNNLDESMASALGIIEMSHEDSGKKLINLFKKIDYNYGFMDAYSYMCVASGKLDFSIGLIDNAWDRAAAAIIVKEAGGDFSDLSGINSYYNETFLISNKKLHDKILEAFD